MPIMSMLCSNSFPNIINLQLLHNNDTKDNRNGKKELNCRKVKVKITCFKVSNQILKMTDRGKLSKILSK